MKLSTKYAFLLILVFQTTAMVLVLRYSRKLNVSQSTKYITMTTIFLAELVKLVTSFTFIHLESSKVFSVAFFCCFGYSLKQPCL